MPVLGIDLGGTNTKFGVVDSTGRVLKASSIPTLPNEGPWSWIERITTASKDLGLGFTSVGIGSPGPLNTSTGTILNTPNLKPFCDFPFRKLLQDGFQTDVLFENDANCAALAEFKFGHKKGSGELVVLTLGTGVGSGVISNGQLLRGHQGYAVELGHMIVLADGPTCHCGKRGCFEALVGARATLQRFLDAHKKPVPGLTMKELFTRFRLGEPAAAQTVDLWVTGLAIGISNAIAIFNPQSVVLAGGVSDAWPLVRDRFLMALSPLVEKHLMDSVTIELSSLGEFFGVQGAAALLLNSH